MAHASASMKGGVGAQSAPTYLYVASAAVYEPHCVFKLGATINPRSRLSTYQTGCPPGFTPSHEIVYVALWEIDGDAINLYDAEAALHDHFYRYRLTHGRRNDTEWFRFPVEAHMPPHPPPMNPLEQIRAFLSRQPWFKQEIPTDALPVLTRPRFLQNPTPSNRGFLKMDEARIAALTLIQDPVIHAIREWFADPTREAGILLAPCGSGKTIMTTKAVEGIHEIKRMIICVPSHTIQTQWAKALRTRPAAPAGLLCAPTPLSHRTFSSDDIHCLGSQGTNDLPTIREWMERDTFCLLVPYASSHHLVDLLTPHVQLIVLDEAHHMAGVVMSDANQDNQENQKHIGITRSLMKRAVDLHIKRLSLTFTPRNLYSDDDLEFMSMDNAAIFGRPIAELNLRKLIQQGILPDYRIWTLRDEARAGTGIIGMAECLLEAWGVTEMVRNMKQPHAPRMEQPLLHHMIIFAATNEEAARLAEHLRERLADTRVFCVKGGQSKETAQAIHDFEAAPRAILVNCRVLGEGVDIPIANAVAITYAKHAMGDITQMILRPGRWSQGKPLFHMLFPILGDEDMSGFQNVLTALASCDTSIRDEILLRAQPPVAPVEPPGPLPEPSVMGGEHVERILMDDMDGTDVERIRACFQRTRQAVFSVYDSRQIQALCLEKGVDTSVEYHTVLRPYTDLPEDPRPRSITWYDYLHPHAVDRMVATGRIAAAVFVKEILEKYSLRMALTYTEWREVQPASVRATVPSVQHILDGYFGADMVSFNDLLVRYGSSLPCGKRNGRR